MAVSLEFLDKCEKQLKEDIERYEYLLKSAKSDLKEVRYQRKYAEKERNKEDGKKHDDGGEC